MIVYHGTREPEAVLREGLKESFSRCCRDGFAPGCIWFTRTPEDAESFGTVLAIDMAGLPGRWPIPGPEDNDNWYARYVQGDISPERISLYKEQPV
ncbi:hypothetical protein LCGC14_0430240 [marine sediment metagenome]|uniref:Uncharacterized protein n=1 Tax=marine sediment metagenome TaxID=412755 RepID=A0A0F9VXZ2_9ZZZZ